MQHKHNKSKDSEKFYRDCSWELIRLSLMKYFIIPTFENEGVNPNLALNFKNVIINILF